MVDNEVVSLTEVYDLGGEFISQRCAPATTGTCVHEAELQVIDALIQRVLVRLELQKLNVDVTGEDIDRGIDGMVREYQMDDRDALRREFARQGIAWDTVREQVSEELRTYKFQQQVISPRVVVSENDLVDLYQRTVRDVGGVEKYDLEAFSVPIAMAADAETRQAAIAKVTAVVAELNAGTREWLPTVKELDTGPYAARDGKMGSFAKDELAPVLKDTVIATPAGQVAPPIDLGPAIVVVKVIAINTGGVKPFEEVAPALRQKVFEAKAATEMEQWYIQARREASVRILLDE